MFKAIATLALLGIAAMLLIAGMRPKQFRVQRSQSMRAAPETVFALVNDFHEHQRWSPWETMDPHMQRSHSGAQAGVGAVYEWAGNGQVGSGRMQITQSTPAQRVVVALHFDKPFKADNTVEYQLDSGPSGTTTVTQTMHGPSHFMHRLMGLFFSMDKMVGGKFEEGLANLKRLAEAEPARLN
jgi:uncharacterized protein YndB with AHSA1/START domain